MPSLPDPAGSHRVRAWVACCIHSPAQWEILGYRFYEQEIALLFVNDPKGEIETPLLSKGLKRSFDRKKLKIFFHQLPELVQNLVFPVMDRVL